MKPPGENLERRACWSRQGHQVIPNVGNRIIEESYQFARLQLFGDERGYRGPNSIAIADAFEQYVSGHADNFAFCSRGNTNFLQPQIKFNGCVLLQQGKIQ